MAQDYINKFSDTAKRLQEPMQAIAELNIKTLQGLNYLKPEDLAGVKRPEEFLGKQIGLAISNGHKALDYLERSFDILEKAMLNCVQECKDTVVSKDKK
jgi:hypothetical protein